MATEAQIERKRKKVELALGLARGTTGEPVITNNDNYRVQLMLALNWYNANTENKYRCEYYKTLCQNTTMYYIYLGVAMVTHIFMILIYHSWQLDKR